MSTGLPSYPPSGGGGSAPATFMLTPTFSEGGWVDGVLDTLCGNNLAGGGTTLDGLSGTYTDAPAGLHRLDVFIPQVFVRDADTISVDATSGTFKATVNGVDVVLPFDISTDSAALYAALQWLPGIDSDVYVEPPGVAGDSVIHWATKRRPIITVEDIDLAGGAATVTLNTSTTAPWGGSKPAFDANPAADLKRADLGVFAIYPGPVYKVLAHVPLDPNYSPHALTYSALVPLDAGSPTIVAIYGGLGGSIYVQVTGQDDTGNLTMSVALTPVEVA